MRAASLSLLVLALAAGCIDTRYVPGGPCSASGQCPVLNDPSNADIDPPQIVEQCLLTGSPDGLGTCVPMPFSREVTSCTTPQECTAAGFPVEVSCDGVTCRCDFQLTTCEFGWDPQQCTCSLPE